MFSVISTPFSKKCLTKKCSVILVTCQLVIMLFIFFSMEQKANKNILVNFVVSLRFYHLTFSIKMNNNNGKWLIQIMLCGMCL